jgi:uncharacterized protein YcbX
MKVAEIWRYPVKSLKGEPLPEADVTALGIAGDREIVVTSTSTGRVLTARKYPRLLGLRGGIGADGVTTINGTPWNSHEAQKLVEEAVGQPIELVKVTGPERFDILPLLVATDGAFKTMGFDSRRFRPNILIGGVEGLAEREWPPSVLSIGEVRIGIERLRPRCVMTTYDPDTQVQDNSVLKRIVSELDGTMALDCRVLHAGKIRVGDEVVLAKGAELLG